MAQDVTSLELFAFVVLPIGVAASAWAVVLVAERRGVAKAGPRVEVPPGQAQQPPASSPEARRPTLRGGGAGRG